MFDIVNVAGSGDEEEKSGEALSKVKEQLIKQKRMILILLLCPVVN